MYSTALTIAIPGTSAEEQRALFTQARLVSLYEAFAVIPDPRSLHGLRYDLPYLLTCLVAALLSNCNSTEAVGQWCRDQEALLRAYFGRRDFLYSDGVALSPALTPLRCASDRGGAGCLGAEQSA
jgi:DDE_Tnp_1-associated